MKQKASGIAGKELYVYKAFYSFSPPFPLTFADRGVLIITGGVRASFTPLSGDMTSLLVTMLWGRNASLLLLALFLKA